MRWQNIDFVSTEDQNTEELFILGDHKVFIHDINYYIDWTSEDIALIHVSIRQICINMTDRKRVADSENVFHDYFDNGNTPANRHKVNL